MPSTACHTSPYSGSWYPGERSRLEDLLNELFERSASRTGPYQLPHPLGLVVPHAGLMYSGTVAAAAYRHLQQERPRTIVLLGFTHRGAPPGAWIPPIGAYRTPLGEVAVDNEVATELLAHPEFGSLREEGLCDHSIEIQLPLVQHACPESSVVPLYVSDLSEGARERIAGVLRETLAAGAVLVASSDFTHYGRAFNYRPFPEDRLTRSRLESLDRDFIEAASGLDAGPFLKALDDASATVCGREPIAVLLETLGAAPNGEEIVQTTLDYQTSGEITGDYSHSVSYAALGYFEWEAYRLAEEDQKALLESARETLRLYQETGRAIPVPPAGGSAALKRRAAAFVTLRRTGELRGCVGRCVSMEPLASTVPDLTISAAMDDTRFEPVRATERDIEIEISVLSPMKRLWDYCAFRINRDGGYLKAAHHAGLLLPQVACGRQWTSRDFLHALAEKAGVGTDAYSDPETKLYVFRAQVIH